MEGSTKAVLKVIMLSISYLLVFLAFNGTQTIMSSLLPGNLGYWSMACLYIFFTTSALLFSAAFVLHAGAKWSLFIGGVMYVTFIFANIMPMWETLIPGAVIVGVGASIIWAGEGSYVTQAAITHAKESNRPLRSSMGLFTGIFFGIFQLSMVIGNIISSVILRPDGESSSISPSSLSDSSDSPNKMNPNAKKLFIVYTIIAVVGDLGLLFLPHPSSNGKKSVDVEENEGQKKKQMSTCERLAGAIHLLGDKKMLLMVPFLLFTGLEQAFMFGVFTKEFISVHHGVHMVGFIMSVFGAVDSIFSFLLGKLADKIGVRWMAYGGVFFLTIFIVTLLTLTSPSIQNSLIAAYSWAAILGLADAFIFGVFCNAAIAMLFPSHSEAAFSVVKVFQAGGTALMFFFGTYLSFFTKLIIMTSTMVVAIVCVFILDVFVFPLRPQKTSSKNVQEDSEEKPLVADKD